MTDLSSIPSGDRELVARVTDLEETPEPIQDCRAGSNTPAVI